MVDYAVELKSGPWDSSNNRSYLPTGTPNPLLHRADYIYCTCRRCDISQPSPVNTACVTGERKRAQGLVGVDGWEDSYSEAKKKEDQYQKRTI